MRWRCVSWWFSCSAIGWQRNTKHGYSVTSIGMAWPDAKSVETIITRIVVGNRGFPLIFLGDSAQYASNSRHAPYLRVVMEWLICACLEKKLPLTRATCIEKYSTSLHVFPVLVNKHHLYFCILNFRTRIVSMHMRSYFERSRKPGRPFKLLPTPKFACETLADQMDITILSSFIKT